MSIRLSLKELITSNNTIVALMKTSLSLQQEAVKHLVTQSKALQMLLELAEERGMGKIRHPNA